MTDKISINEMHREFMRELCYASRKPCEKWFAWLKKEMSRDIRTSNLDKATQFSCIKYRAIKNVHRSDFRTPASLLHHSYNEAYDHFLTERETVVPTSCPIPMYDKSGSLDLLLLPAEVSDYYWEWDNAVIDTEYEFDILNA